MKVYDWMQEQENSIFNNQPIDALLNKFDREKKRKYHVLTQAILCRLSPTTAPTTTATTVTGTTTTTTDTITSTTTIKNNRRVQNVSFLKRNAIK